MDYKWEAMIFHNIISDLVPNFGKGPKRVKQTFTKTYFLPRERLIGSTKIQLKNLKFGIWYPNLSKNTGEIGFFLY